VKREGIEHRFFGFRFYVLGGLGFRLPGTIVTISIPSRPNNHTLPPQHRRLRHTRNRNLHLLRSPGHQRMPINQAGPRPSFHPNHQTHGGGNRNLG
jgi:hypothetical protein